jgi:diguanylate cyclase (GGDEF)-like protein/PAS domain S-box-containing protein
MRRRGATSRTRRLRRGAGSRWGAMAARLPLRTTLLLGMAAPLLCLAAAGFAFLLAEERANRREAVHGAIRSAIVALTGDFHRVALLQDQSAAVELVDRLRNMPTVDRIFVLDGADAALFTYTRPGLLPSSLPSARARTGPDWIEVALEAGGRPVGMAVVQESDGAHGGALSAHVLRLGLVAAALVTASLLIAAILSRVLAVPILRVTAFVVETARTLDTSKRLRIDGRHEVGALAGAINRLLREIASQREQLQATNVRVEAEVEQRTRELRASERRLRALATHAPVGIFETDREGGCVFVNHAWTEITGCGPDRALGRDWTDVVHPEDRERVAAEWTSIIDQDAEDAISEFRIARPDGRLAWVCGGGVALRDEGGRPTGQLGTLTDITERKRMEEDLRFGAFHDILTGLPNRSRIMRELAGAINRMRAEPSALFALLYMDFDRFKQINDTLGHDAGDAFLIAAARRIEAQAEVVAARTGSPALPARLGGDEFVLLLEGIGGPHEAVAVAEALGAALAEPWRLGSTDVDSSASIGVAVGSPCHESPDDVLRDADLAMYQSKQTERGRVTVFDERIRDAAVMRARTESELRAALERGELTLFYQPIMRLSDRQPAGFEALVRWNHPTRGMLAPAEFLDIAEENGLIIPLGRWALKEACRQARRWQSWMPDPEPLFVSVNIARRHVATDSLVDDVQAALTESGIDPASLLIEITEGNIMENVDESIRTLSRLRSLGIGIAMDDFGAGHSSLAYLKQLPLDKLKIDRSFLTGLTGDKGALAILHAIIAMASNLRIPAIAEGIETFNELAALLDLDCAMGQGFLLARPMPADEIPAWCVRTAAGPVRLDTRAVA